MYEIDNRDDCKTGNNKPIKNEKLKDVVAEADMESMSDEAIDESLSLGELKQWGK